MRRNGSRRASSEKSRVKYRYDALGNRLERNVEVGLNPGITRYAYDGLDVYADLNSAGAVEVRYVRGDDVDALLARVDSTHGVLWYLTDRKGSVLSLLRDDGKVVRRVSYDAWDKPFEADISTLRHRERYAAAGREDDTNDPVKPDRKLRYQRGRWYDPDLGRWVNESAEGLESGDFNQYRYNYNNPHTSKSARGDNGWFPHLRRFTISSMDYNSGGVTKEVRNFTFGVVDTVLGGLKARARGWVGWDDIVDMESTAYRWGGYTGQAINIGLMVINPASLVGAAAYAVRTLQVAQMAGGIVAGVDASI